MAQGQIWSLLANRPRWLVGKLQDRDSAKADRAMRAMMQMGKLDIQRLQQAYNQS